MQIHTDGTDSWALVSLTARLRQKFAKDVSVHGHHREDMAPRIRPSCLLLVNFKEEYYTRVIVSWFELAD